MPEVGYRLHRAGGSGAAGAFPSAVDRPGCARSPRASGNYLAVLGPAPRGILQRGLLFGSLSPLASPLSLAASLPALPSLPANIWPTTVNEYGSAWSWKPEPHEWPPPSM